MTDKFISKFFKNNDEKIPLWLKLINGINLIPILVYPLVFIFSFFLMDNPNIIIGLGSFFLINSYPLVLIGTIYISFTLYLKNIIILAISIPITVSCLLIIFFLNTFHH